MFGSEITIDSEILGMVRKLKHIFRNITAKLPSVDAPTMYPKTAAEFKEKFLLLYEAAYHGEEEPIVVADETAWLCRIANVPLRCTKAGCASPLDASITRQGNTKQQHATVALMHMLAQHQRATSPSQAMDPFGGLHNLQIFQQKQLGGPGSSSSGMQLAATPAQLLAIEGPPPGLRYGSQASCASHACGSQDGSQASSASAGAQPGFRDGSQASSASLATGAQPGFRDGSQASVASLAAGAQPVVAAAAASSVDCMVEQLRLQLNKGKGNVMKRPAAAALDGRRLGCSKCRYGPGGCTQCREVTFTGKRLKE
jgi:hypothetical protein